MTKIRKLFRGSGRILGLIFVASIIWLIFDMAALRFSFTEINSKLSKEEFLRLERLRSKVLQDEGLHKMFRRRPGGGLARGERVTRALRGNPGTPSRQSGGAVGFGRNNEDFRARAPAKQAPDSQLLLAAPGTVRKEPNPQPTGRRSDHPQLAHRVAGVQTTVAHPGPVVAASSPTFLPGPGQNLPEVQALKPGHQGAGEAVDVSLKVVTELEWEGQVNRSGPGRAGTEDGVKLAEARADTNRSGMLVAADALGYWVPLPGGEKRVQWTAVNAPVQATGAKQMKNIVNQSRNEVWNGLEGEFTNNTENKITVGGKAWDGALGSPVHNADRKNDPVHDTDRKSDPVHDTDRKSDPVHHSVRKSDPVHLSVRKSDPVHNTDRKIPVHSKIWKGTPGELVNITDSKNVGLNQNVIKYTPLTNVVNKTAINRIESKNTPLVTEKKDSSVKIVEKVNVKSNETNDQRIGGNVLKRPVANLESVAEVHKVLSIDRTISPRNPGAVGQFGQPAVVPRGEEERAKEKWNEGHFNVHLSNMIPLDRSIPDTRPKGCSDQLVHNSLPTTSIILCFVDEVWSTLLRSVHSIFNRSPAHLIKEVILVDDFSTREYLKENLDIYMSRFPKVHVIHLQERHGLIRARLVGAASATGDVLTFLDSHVECNVGWLEPLLERIHLKRTKVACPVIEVISDEDMSYIGVNGFLRGVFTWPMNFGWKTIPEEIIKKYNLTEMDPIKCPIMAGGLFSIDKKYFYELGTYDTGLEVWGGENMELSFKVWMCGGEIEIIPCSRVGHIFRDGNPYTFPKDRIKTVERNLARVAEVWLDEYVDVFYGHGYHHLLNTNNIEFNIGDLSKQKELRKKLQCKSFKWYLENIYPDIQTSLVRSDGLLFNVGTRNCLAVENGTFSFELCDINKKNQHFSHSWLKLIQQRDLCMALDTKREIGMKPCNKKSNNLRWFHQSFTADSTLVDHILWEVSQFPLCLEGNLFGKVLMINSCDPDNSNQKWKFTNYYKD
ncbi:polypeptide N-acetylgalactosaminyltransferase 5 isoform X1 [Mobula hypostoma]|uniref:polypeptide N-acetylgalactosaminyltransferase 5 isoform X1 n=1 Tax=Mobula hypostoma TaxID=723540 RepID=UPI002FC2CB5C